MELSACQALTKSDGYDASPSQTICHVDGLTLFFLILTANEHGPRTTRCRGSYVVVFFFYSLTDYMVC